MKTPIYWLVIFLFFGNLTQAQVETHFTLKGKVIDKKSNEPLAFAHVGIPSLGIGTTTSDLGEFNLKIPTISKGEDLTVSYIGYFAYRKKVSELTSPTTIKLEIESASLVEIEVMDQKGVEDIIRKAVKRIPKNYPTYGHTDLGFYREARTDTAGKYIYLAEGVLNIYKKSYRSKKEGQVSLVQGRKINLRNPLDTTVRSGFSSGHMAAHRFDIVYNREDFLQEKYFPFYNYWIENMTTYNGNPVYVIAFAKDHNVADEPNKGGLGVGGWRDENNSRGFGIFGKRKIGKKARMTGRIYIDKKTYAIIRSEFEITKKGLRKTNDYPLYSGSWKANSYIVNYQQIGKKWFFSDAFRKGKYGGGGTYTNEVKITEINPKKSKSIPYLERIGRNQRFTRMTGSYDPNFWKNYNTTPLNAELAATVDQLENAKTAQEKLDPIYLAELQLRRDSIAYVKRQKEIEGEENDIEFDMSEMEIYNSQMKNIQKKKKLKRKFNRFSSSWGIGTHLISTDQRSMGVTVLSENNPSETILSLNGEMKSREIEIVASMDYDFFFTRNIHLRVGSAFDFYNSRYKERSVGMGFQMNMSKRRPVFFRAIAQYSNMKYYRKIGDADNDFGKFKIDKKKLKSDKIRVGYGSRTHNLKLSGEFAIELNPAREIYVRGTYFMPFSRRQDIWLQERKELFRKKTKVPVSNERVLVTENDIPFNGQIMPEETIKITIGIVLK